MVVVNKVSNIYVNDLIFMIWLVTLVLLQITNASEERSPCILRSDLNNVHYNKTSGLHRYVNKIFALLARCAA
jgi:hypothetical protein